MSVGDKQVFDAVCSFLDQKSLEYTIKEEKYCDHFYIKSGALKADVCVYNTGKIVIGGPDSILKEILEGAKHSLMTGNLDPINELPFEIEKFPETIKERVPKCDEVILKLIDAAIRSYKADIPLATAFLVGAASEKAISLLIDFYAASIGDKENQARFQSRIGKKKVVSAKYDEFMASYKSCKTKCNEPSISNDLEIILDSMFQFYRITRNEVGHPQAAQGLNKGILLANLGQFVLYIERIYGLIGYFQKNEMVV